MTSNGRTVRTMKPKDVQRLLDVLGTRGYEIIGPTMGEHSIHYAPIDSMDDLPVGWTDIQSPGFYRTQEREDNALFGFNAPQNSWKDYLFAPMTCLWSARKQNGDGFEVETHEPSEYRYAFVGVRPCEFEAIRIQDRVFLEGEYENTDYRARRENLFLVVVGCTEAGDTCFCASMETGPDVRSPGFDLSLIEVLDNGDHYLLAEAGTDRGREVLDELSHRPASEAERETGRRKLDEASEQMGRQLETSDLVERLYENLEHPRWDEVARRCLSCGNCTMVCPTCFCSRIQDTTSLNGDTAERWRCRDVCFHNDFTFIHGGSIRSTIRSRYRQWLTHKLATWVDQFGEFGCVGCGRCLTWCPVGIDITEEANAIRPQPSSVSNTFQ